MIRAPINCGHTSRSEAIDVIERKALMFSTDVVNHNNAAIERYRFESYLEIRESIFENGSSWIYKW